MNTFILGVLLILPTTVYAVPYKCATEDSSRSFRFISHVINLLPGARIVFDTDNSYTLYSVEIDPSSGDTKVSLDISATKDHAEASALDRVTVKLSSGGRVRGLYCGIGK